MTIYQSSKAVPYVYMCIHKETKEFYIGYRELNVKLNTPSHIDFPKYKTSSKIVKPSFDNFDWIILAEFFSDTSKIDAFAFEQELINYHWHNPLLLNKNCLYNKDKKYKQQSGWKMTSEQKKKCSIARKGRIPPNKGITSPHKGKSYEEIYGDEKAKELRKSRSESNRKRKLSDATKALMSMKQKNKSPETRKKLSHNAKNRQQIICPHCNKSGGKPQMIQWHFDNCKYLNIDK